MKINFYHQYHVHSIDLSLFNGLSTYFSNQSIEYQEKTDLYLFSDFDFPLNHDENSINAFFQFFENPDIEINTSNAITLKYLSVRFQVSCLKEQTNKFINEHYQFFINEFLCEKGKHLKEQKFEYEKQLSLHLDEYLNDDRLLYLPISTLNRILELYFIDMKNKNEFKILDFLIKIVNFKGTDSTVLFTNFKHNKECILYIIEKINDIESIENRDLIQTILIQDSTMIFEIIKNQDQQKSELQNDIQNILNEIQNMKRSYEQRLQSLEEDRIKQQKEIDQINNKQILESKRIEEQKKGDL